MIPYFVWKRRAEDSPFLERAIRSKGKSRWHGRTSVLWWGATLAAGVFGAIADEAWPLGLYYSLPGVFLVLQLFLLRDAWNRYKRPAELILAGATREELLVLPQPLVAMLSPSVWLSARAVALVYLTGLIPPAIWIWARMDLLVDVFTPPSESIDDVLRGLAYLLVDPPHCFFLIALVLNGLLSLSLLGPFFRVEATYWKGVLRRSKAPFRDIVCLGMLLGWTALFLTSVILVSLIGFHLVFYEGSSSKQHIARLIVVPFFVVGCLCLFYSAYSVWIIKGAEKVFDRLQDQMCGIPREGDECAGGRNDTEEAEDG